MNRKLSSLMVVVVIFQLLTVSAVTPMARAEMISTRTLLEQSRDKGTVDRIDSMIAREDVRQDLEKLGVDPALVRQRLASLTPGEIAQLQTQMDQMPAGAGVLEVIGIVFVVLLILELVGVTNVFNRM